MKNHFKIFVSSPYPCPDNFQPYLQDLPLIEHTGRIKKMWIHGVFFRKRVSSVSEDARKVPKKGKSSKFYFIK